MAGLKGEIGCNRPRKKMIHGGVERWRDNGSIGIVGDLGLID